MLYGPCVEDQTSLLIGTSRNIGGPGSVSGPRGRGVGVGRQPEVAFLPHDRVSVRYL